MSDHPSTFNGFDPDKGDVQWDDRASIHRADDGGGLLNDAKSLASGTLSDMVAWLMAYPENERTKYVVEKDGDHRLSLGEVLTLAARPDYPHR